MAKRSLKAVLLAVVLTMIAAGCANNPSTYATVDGHRISSADYEQTSASVLEYYRSAGTPDQQLPQKANVGQIMILGTVVHEHNKAKGTTPSQAKIDEALKQSNLTELANHNEHTRAFANQLGELVLMPKAQTQQLSLAANVEVNPRLGKWAKDQRLSLGSNSLSLPGPGASAT